MTNKCLSILVLLGLHFLSCFSGYSQSLQLLSFSNQEPVSYARILVYNFDSVITEMYSNSKGELTFAANSVFDSIRITHMSFEDTTMAFSNVNGILFLHWDTKPLETVDIVHTGKSKTKYLGYAYKRKTKCLFDLSNLSRVKILVSVTNPYEIEKKINSFIFYTEKQKNTGVSCNTEIFIYENKEGKIGKLIYSESSQSFLKKGIKQEISLGDENIFLPKDGFFIGIGFKRNTKTDLDFGDITDIGIPVLLGATFLKEEHSILHYEAYDERNEIVPFWFFEEANDVDTVVLRPFIGLSVFE